MSGNTYRHNHNLIEQIDILNDCGATEPLFDKISSKAEMYNSREAESRYKDNFVALKKDIEEAFEICKEMVNLVKSKVSQ